MTETDRALGMGLPDFVNVTADSSVLEEALLTFHAYKDEGHFKLVLPDQVYTHGALYGDPQGIRLLRSEIIALEILRIKLIQINKSWGEDRLEELQEILRIPSAIEEWSGEVINGMRVVGTQIMDVAKVREERARGDIPLEREIERRKLHDRFAPSLEEDNNKIDEHTMKAVRSYLTEQAEELEVSPEELPLPVGKRSRVEARKYGILLGCEVYKTAFNATSTKQASKIVPH